MCNEVLKTRTYSAQEVEAKFEKYGPVKEARIVRNPVNNESRGFGFVAMKYEEDVDAVSNTYLYPQASSLALRIQAALEPSVYTCTWPQCAACCAGHQGTGWCRVAGQAPWR